MHRSTPAQARGGKSHSAYFLKETDSVAFFVLVGSPRFVRLASFALKGGQVAAQ